jgi:hypothetical protein
MDVTSAILTHSWNVLRLFPNKGNEHLINGGVPLQKENTGMTRLQETIVQTVEQCFDSSWGRDIQNNWGFVIDLQAITDAQGSNELRILDRFVNNNGIAIYVTVSDTRASLADITHVIYRLLERVAEGFLVIMPLQSQDALRFWFMTGYETHGHIGEVIIRYKDISHIELSRLDNNQA